MPSADELIHFKDYYINKVNMFRNRLGHVKLGEQVLHIQGKDVPIDQALHRMLRKNISEVEKTFLVYSGSTFEPPPPQKPLA